MPSWKAVCSLFSHTTDQITLERERSYFLNEFFARRLSQRFGLATRFGSWVKQTGDHQSSPFSLCNRLRLSDSSLSAGERLSCSGQKNSAGLS